MAIQDKFDSYTSGLTAPATGILTINPSDTTDLEIMPRAIMVATAGDVAVVMQDGTTGTAPGLSECFTLLERRQCAESGVCKV